MKKYINRDSVLAVFDMKKYKDRESGYILDMIKENKVYGDLSLITMIICEDRCFMVNKSSRYITKKLNSANFLIIGGYNEE